MKPVRNILQFLFIIFVFNLYGQDGQEYKNDEYSYSFIFPDGWEYYEANELYYVIRCELRDIDTLKKVADGTISIMILKLQGLTQEQLIEQNMKIMKLLGKDIEEIKEEETTLNGINALYLEYTYNWKKQDLPERQIDIRYYIQKDDLLYIVYYSGQQEVYNKYKEIINSSLNSFTII